MSWDLYAMKLPAGARSVDEIPGDYVPPPIAPRAEVIAAISTAVPGADFSDPRWGLIDTPAAAIEVNLGDDDPVESFALHVRGGGDEVLGVIAAILDSVGVTAVDSSSGDLFDPATAGRSWAAWQAYRRRVI
jgi:hypothetical protein